MSSERAPCEPTSVTSPSPSPQSTKRPPPIANSGPDSERPLPDESKIWAAPSEDWSPEGPGGKRAPAGENFHAVAITSPGTESTVLLGAKHVQKFEVSNAGDAPRNTRYKWHHQILGDAAAGEELVSGEEGSKVSNALVLRPRVPGTKTIRTQLEQTSPKAGKNEIDVHDVTLTTPRPEPTGAPRLESTSKEGKRRPVSTFLSDGEDLLVTVEMDQFDPTVTDVKPDFTSSLMNYVAYSRVGPTTFEVRVRPAGVGPAIGYLRLPMLDMSRKDAPPVIISVDVRAVSGPDDAGGRPNDAADAVSWVEASTSRLFDQRKQGVDDVYKQLQHKDLPEGTSMWKSILYGVAMIALNAFSAGFATTLSNLVVKDPDFMEATTEFVKVMFEEAMSGAVLGSLSAGLGPDGPTPPKDAALAFTSAQQTALDIELLERQKTGLSTLRNTVERLERKQPGEGARYATELDSALTKGIGSAASRQYLETLQAWCTAQARSATLHEGDKRTTTNLEKLVEPDDTRWKDPASIKDMTNMFTGVAGVLELELEDHFGGQHFVGDDGTESWSLSIKAARVGGLPNQKARDAIALVPIAELKMPVVARFERSSNVGIKDAIADDKGCVIGRNEANEFWASEIGNYLTKDTRLRTNSRGDMIKAAEYILRQEIGFAKVKPEG